MEYQWLRLTHHARDIASRTERAQTDTVHTITPVHPGVLGRTLTRFFCESYSLKKGEFGTTLAMLHAREQPLRAT